MFRQLVESFRNDLRTNPKMVKIMAVFLGGVLLVAVASIVIAVYGTDAPDPSKDKLSDIEQYLSSESFLKKPVAYRKEYINDVTDRIQSSKDEEMGGFLKRLYGKNKNAGDVVQINMLSDRLKPLSQLDEKERAQKINAMISMAEMTQGRQKMQKNYKKMFGEGSSERKKKVLSDAVRAMPNGMKSTTPKERKQLIQTIRQAKKQMEQRYGEPSTTGQPKTDK